MAKGKDMQNISNYTSAVLALIIAIGLIALIALGQVVPGELWGAFGTVIGFFFGTGANTSKQ